MADQHEPPEFSSFEEATLQYQRQGMPDWALLKFVDIANRTQAGMTMTLYLGGSVVTGILIGGREYFEMLGQQIAPALGKSPEEGKELYRELVDQHYPSMDEENEEGPPPSFVHMKGARVISPTGSMPSEGMLWRGRLSRVDGFSIGTLRQA